MEGYKAMQETEVTYKCEICFDENVPASKGGFCSNAASPKFFCGVAHNDCFSDMILLVQVSRAQLLQVLLLRVLLVMLIW